MLGWEWIKSNVYFDQFIPSQAINGKQIMKDMLIQQFQYFTNIDQLLNF